jgi:hypothetical protein
VAAFERGFVGELSKWLAQNGPPGTE